MKTIKIGEGEYNLLESVNDINDKRFTFFKAYLLKSLEGIDRPLFRDTMDRALEFFNQSRYMQAWAEFQNYQRAIEYEDYNDDALSKCFALICIEQDEDQLNVDDNFLASKLERMWADGLTRGFVEESVQNFSKASPTSLGSYSLMLEEVMLNLEAMSLNDLESLQKNLEKLEEKKD
jgi:hypothetical protein